MIEIRETLIKKINKNSELFNYFLWQCQFAPMKENELNKNGLLEKKYRLCFDKLSECKNIELTEIIQVN